MSDLARSFAAGKLKYSSWESVLGTEKSKENAKITGEGEEKKEELETHEEGLCSSASSVETIKPDEEKSCLSPTTSWSVYFDQELFLETKYGNGQAKFHVYIKPALNLEAPFLVFHHGAGSSGMSFATLATEIRNIYPEVGILSVEARCHGSAVWNMNGQTDEDMSLESLSNDMVQMIMLTKEKLGWNVMPRLILIGHSLGGAVITEVAKTGRLGQSLIAYAVIDVVEGSAIEALTFMQSYLSTRPPSFKTVEDAIEWHIRSRTIRNPESAKASVPALLSPAGPDSWSWKTDLSTTQPFWRGWFSGLSSKFLSARGAKLLILAGTDRLDKELMIGQMQGTSPYIHPKFKPFYPCTS